MAFDPIPDEDEPTAREVISPATADRMRRFARAWLQVEMAAE